VSLIAPILHASDDVRLTVLGSGGWIPTGERETCCALVEDGDRALLIDAGSGVRHLVADPDLLRGRRELSVLLTHFHGDHTVGISYLPALGLDRVAIHGAGAALYGVPTREILERVYTHPQAAFDLAEVASEVHDVDLGLTEPGGIPIELRRQDMHPDPTLGVRIGDRYAWCTDTGADPETASFARGVAVLFHDMWALDVERPVGHASGAECGQLADAAGAGMLVGIHLSPLPAVDHERIRAEAAARFAAASLSSDHAVY
jgi:ribonuclease BN (tRNA processing enzyme)